MTSTGRTSRPRRTGRHGIVAMTTVGVVVAGATLAVADIITPNTSSLTAVGPTSAVHGFPVWYEDDKDLRLEQCLDLADPLCDPAFLRGEMANPDAPMSFPDNFPLESFYYQAGNDFDLPGGGSVVFVSALEATFANEAPIDGDQVVFGRLRIRVDGLQDGATYTVTHPYGADSFVAEAGEINFTEDIAPVPGDFGAALGSRIAPFLVDADGLITTATGSYVGDPAVETTVTGSPFGTNSVRITGPGLDVTDDTFVLMGKVSTNSGVEGVAAYRIDHPTGQDYLDVYATSDPGRSLQVSGAGVPLTALASSGGDYFARIPVTTFPADVAVVNASDVPPAEKTVPVTDNVAVTSATYTDGTLTVAASSSDDGAVLTGTAGPTPLVFTAGTATASGLVVPPVSVTVTSDGGGRDSAPVVVLSATAGQRVPQTAVIAGVSAAPQGASVTLDGSSSANATAFGWAQTAGPDVLTGVGTTGPTLTFTTPAEATTLTFVLTTTGPDGAVASAPHSVQVLDAAQLPTVTATASNATPEVGAQVTLTADATNATSYLWAQDPADETQLTGLTLTGPTLVFTAPPTPVTFTVTVTGPGGLTASDTVTVTPNRDQLTVTRAELRTNRNEWRVDGTATVVTDNTVTVWLRQPDGSKGAVVGSDAPDAVGVWSIRVRNLPPNGATGLVVESTKGGSIPNQPFTSRR